jgi:hypothetical protein
MPDRKFDLGDYIEVKDRIKLFYELYANGRLVTTDVRLTSEPDGVPRVLVEAAAYRSPDDPLPGRGWSWMVLPGTTSYTRGSELENTETSAWGRAIASLGILVDKSIASAQEVQNKQGQAVRPQRQDEASDARMAGKDPGGIVGVIEESKAWAPHYEPKIDPILGFVLEFKLVSDGRGGGIKVHAHGPLAEQLSDIGDDLTGQRVTAWGPIEDETYRPKNAKKDITYQVLRLERISGPFGMLPRDEGEEPPIPVAEGQVEAFKLDPEERALIGGSDD